MTITHQIKTTNRRGAIMVWTTFMLIVVLAFVAFAVDVGFLSSAKSDLQNAADASARAAARALPQGQTEIELRARRFAEINQVNHKTIRFLPGEDLEVGIWDPIQREFSPLPMNLVNLANATRITTRLDQRRGTGLRLPFAPILGWDKTQVSAIAVAAIHKQIRGFSDPGEQKYHPILPFTLDHFSWEQLENGLGADRFSWNEELEMVEPGPDGLPEINLFPSGNYAPGNRGYIEIGAGGGENSTLNRQIRKGVTGKDLDFHGGELVLDGNDEFTIGGKPGVRASQKDAFESIIGDVRVVPLFAEVSGTGNNTQYEIVGWAGVRVMYVNFGGSPKQVLLQTADVWLKDGVIIGRDGDETSSHVYTLPKLVQ